MPDPLRCSNFLEIQRWNMCCLPAGDMPGMTGPLAELVTCVHQRRTRLTLYDAAVPTHASTEAC